VIPALSNLFYLATASSPQAYARANLLLGSSAEYPLFGLISISGFGTLLVC
jgi:hypothetical protein